MLLLLSLGCAFHTERTGLVLPGDHPTLESYNGGKVRLCLDEESEPLRYLDRAVVVVEGPRFGCLVVKDWHVQDAGDGSSGFVGIVREYGSRLVIDDRNTGHTLVIQDGTAPELRKVAGKPVLLLGHVVGGETIAVAAWRPLFQEEGGK